MIEAFGTYGEISPSGTGVKLFFHVAAGDMQVVLQVLGREKDGKQRYGRQFKRSGEGRHPPSIEPYFGARYSTITGNHLPGMPMSLTTVLPTRSCGFYA